MIDGSPEIHAWFVAMWSDVYESDLYYLAGMVVAACEYYAVKLNLTALNKHAGRTTSVNRE